MARHPGHGGRRQRSELFSNFNASVVRAMSDETASFSDDVVRKGDGLPSTPFTA